MRLIRIALMALGLLVLAVPAAANMAEAQRAYANAEFEQALRIWRDEANNGNADAAWYAGNMYIDGLGVSRPDLDLAINYYEMAVEQDHIEAQVSLGLLYAQGRGVDQDYHHAMALLYEAGLAGHAVAQVELGNYFLDGVEGLVEQSPGHAFEWYGLAALQGVVYAQMRLGQMNFSGIGAPQNQEEGLMWIAIAREVAATQQEPYWSYRVFPLDAPMQGAREDASLRDAVLRLHGDYTALMTPVAAARAEQAAVDWIAAHSN